jgi:hypothetical protein
MAAADEVKAFAREYINGKKTAERTKIVQQAYSQLFGTPLRIRCGTCVIEAIFKILKQMDRKPCRYQLKTGAVLVAFGQADKIATNANLTDELAEWHLRNTRGASTLFSKMPADAPTFGSAETANNDTKDKPSVKQVVTGIRPVTAVKAGDLPKPKVNPKLEAALKAHAPKMEVVVKDAKPTAKPKKRPRPKITKR